MSASPIVSVLSELASVRDNYNKQLESISEYAAFKLVERTTLEVGTALKIAGPLETNEIIEALELAQNRFRDHLTTLPEYRALQAIDKLIGTVTGELPAEAKPSVDIAEPVQVLESVQYAAPTEVAEPDQTAESIQAASPFQAAEFAQSVETVQTAADVQAEPVQVTEFNQAVQPVHTVDPVHAEALSHAAAAVATEKPVAQATGVFQPENAAPSFAQRVVTAITEIVSQPNPSSAEVNVASATEPEQAPAGVTQAATGEQVTTQAA